MPQKHRRAKVCLAVFVFASLPAHSLCERSKKCVSSIQDGEAIDAQSSQGGHSLLPASVWVSAMAFTGEFCRVCKTTQFPSVTTAACPTCSIRSQTQTATSLWTELSRGPPPTARQQRRLDEQARKRAAKRKGKLTPNTRTRVGGRRVCAPGRPRRLPSKCQPSPEAAQASDEEPAPGPE